MISYPHARLLDIYRQHMFPAVDPDVVTLMRWADRIETLARFQVAQRDWTHEQAGTLIDEVDELMRLWRDEMPTWVVETPFDDGTVLSRHMQAPTYEQAIQLFD